MPPTGKRVMLPLRITPAILDLPIDEITLPEIVIPGVSVVPPSTVPPSTLPFRVHDIRGMLATEPAWGIGQAQKNSLTVHWEGLSDIPQFSIDGHTIYFQAIARYHIRKNWASSGVVNGDGIMYHEAIGQNGDAYLMRDDTDILYHANNEGANRDSRAILVLCSQMTPPTDVQIAGLRKRILDWRNEMRFNVPAYPHSHWTGTACPGDTIRAAIAGY